MTVTPFRPLPVGGSQHGCWDHFSDNMQPLLRLPNLPTAIWCRVDTSGESPPTAVLHCTSALARSHTSLPQNIDEHRLEGHRSMYHHRPQSVATTSCRGIKGHSTLAVSAPNRSKRGNCCSARTLPNRAAIPSRKGLKAGVGIVYSKTIYYKGRQKE